MLLAVHQQALFQGLVDLATKPYANGRQQQGGNDRATVGRDDEKNMMSMALPAVTTSFKRLMKP